MSVFEGFVDCHTHADETEEPDYHVHLSPMLEIEEQPKEGNDAVNEGDESKDE